MGTTLRSRTGVVVVVAVAVLALALGLGLTMFGRDDSDGGKPGSSTSSGGGSRTALQKEAEQVSGTLLGAGAEAAPLARAQGSVDTYSDSGRMQPAVAEILAVEVGPSGTLLRWRLRSTGALLNLRSSLFSSSAQPSGSASDIALVNPAANELAKPFRYRPGQFGISCVCSSVPDKVDQTGQELTGLYPPFSQEPTQVEIRIPGFPAITGIPVTRR